MVITITMRNFRIRNGIYWFRIVVPEDCRDAIGQDEVSFSLETSNEQEAAFLIPPHTKEWKKKFKDIRTNARASTDLAVKTIEASVDYDEKLRSHLDQNLVDYIDSRTEEELRDSIKHCRKSISLVKDGSDESVDLTNELGINLPLPKQKSPGMARRLNKSVITALQRIITAIEKEVGQEAPPFMTKLMTGVPTPSPENLPSNESTQSSQGQSGMDITEIMNLMLKAKNTDEKFKDRIQKEIQCLLEWFDGKRDVTQYSKADLVDYVQECLPYIPKNMAKIDTFNGKSLRQCVELTRKHPEKYTPIAYKTCQNRFVGIQSVFNYAKNQLGLIAINPASGIKIPVVRVVEVEDRAFNEDELSTLWTTIAKEAHDVVDRFPERYWCLVLSLYHGFRQNEICSLRCKDVYEDADGVTVISVTADPGVKGKTLKTTSSKRIVPIHPYVLDTLKFSTYVDLRKGAGDANAQLFPNVTYVEGSNFGKKVSVWFRKAKLKHLPIEAHYKNFHSLRHTFIQQAQNQAKMPDRYNQEITGHSVSGVSSVHMGYSGRLKPKDVLEELSKVKYGWE